MSNKLGWAIALVILVTAGSYGYSCMKVAGKSDAFHENLDELRLIFHNHNVRHELVSPELIVDHVLELAARAGVVVNEDDVGITAEAVEIARDDSDGCVVDRSPDSLEQLAPVDQEKLTTGVARSCLDIPRWVIGIHVEAKIRNGLYSRHVVFDRHLVLVRYSEQE